MSSQATTPLALHAAGGITLFGKATGVEHQHAVNVGPFRGDVPADPWKEDAGPFSCAVALR
jgi:hypothetical protein